MLLNYFDVTEEMFFSYIFFCFQIENSNDTSLSDLCTNVSRKIYLHLDFGHYDENVFTIRKILEPNNFFQRFVVIYKRRILKMEVSL